MMSIPWLSSFHAATPNCYTFPRSTCMIERFIRAHNSIICCTVRPIPIWMSTSMAGISRSTEHQNSWTLPARQVSLIPLFLVGVGPSRGGGRIGTR